jgi:HK97 gp10 family phage protein
MGGKRMSDWVTTEIKGLDELQRKLEAMPEKVAKKGLRDALKAGGRILVSALMAFAPRQTGFLSEHFDMRLSIRGEDIAGSAYVGPEGKMDYPDAGGGYREKENRKGKKYRVGRIAVASVARFLEFGTSRMAARPFMTPAWEAHKEIVRDAIIDKLKDAVEEAANE